MFDALQKENRPVFFRMIVMGTRKTTMKRLISAVMGAMCAMGAIAATLPDWAVGTFKGEVKNWCNDSNFSVWGDATLSIAGNGKVSGSITFDDGASGKATGKILDAQISDNEVKLRAEVKWFDERGKADGKSWSDISIWRCITCQDDVYMDFFDNDDEEDDENDKCPVSGWLEKTGSGFAIPAEWQKARTLKGVCGGSCSYGIDGSAVLKCGKANKKGLAKVSLAVTPFNGKKRTYKGVKVDVSQGGEIEVFWPQQGYAVTIDGDEFFGEQVSSDNGYTCDSNAVWSEDVGGQVSGSALFYFGDILYLDSNEEVADYALLDNPNNSCYDFLSIYDDIEFTTGGSRWALPKAARLKWTSSPSNTACLDRDGGGWLAAQTGNLPGLKLSYNAKTGMFKGSFKVYTFSGKKYNAKVTGIVVGGYRGYGVAYCPNLSPEAWNIRVYLDE